MVASWLLSPKAGVHRIPQPSSHGLRQISIFPPADLKYHPPHSPVPKLLLFLLLRKQWGMDLEVLTGKVVA